NLGLGAEEARELGEAIGLGHEADSTAVSALDLTRGQMVRARQHHADVGKEPPNLAGEIEAIEPGHHEIDECNGDPGRCDAQRPECLLARTGHNHVEPFEPEPNGQRSTLILLIVDDQHSGHAAPPAHATIWSGFLWRATAGPGDDADVTYQETS